MTLGHAADMSTAVAWFMAGILQGAGATVVRRSRRASSRRVTECALLERQRLAEFGEGRCGLVALGEKRVLDRPLDPDAGVVPGDSRLGCRVVGARAEVGDVGGLA